MKNWLSRHVRSLRSAGIPVLAGLVAVGLAACGDDGPTGPDISQEQAEEVAAAVTSGVFQGFSIALGQGGGAAARAPEGLTPPSVPVGRTFVDEGSYSFDDSSSCPQGGSVSVSGSGTVNTSSTQTSTTVDWSWNAQASYASCGVETEQGETFVLDTSSPIQYGGSGTVTSSQGSGTTGSFQWNYSGTVDWDEQGGPSASCEMDLTTTLSFSQSSTGLGLTASDIVLSGSVSGTVCGRQVDRSYSATFSDGA